MKITGPHGDTVAMISIPPVDRICRLSTRQHTVRSAHYIWSFRYWEVGPALWVQDVAFINNPITNYHPLAGLHDQQIPLGVLFSYLETQNIFRILYIMEKNNLYKLVLYALLIASTTTLVLTGHDYWAVAMFLLIFSVK